MRAAGRSRGQKLQFGNIPDSIQSPFFSTLDHYSHRCGRASWTETLRAGRMAAGPVAAGPEHRHRFRTQSIAVAADSIVVVVAVVAAAAARKAVETTAALAAALAAGDTHCARQGVAGKMAAGCTRWTHSAGPVHCARTDAPGMAHERGAIGAAVAGAGDTAGTTQRCRPLAARGPDPADGR